MPYMGRGKITMECKEVPGTKNIIIAQQLFVLKVNDQNDNGNNVSRHLCKYL
jgi:hypothetical protein